MPQASLLDLLPQLVSGPPHPQALGFALESVEEDVVTLRCPYREDLIGDPESRVLAGGVVTTLLDHTCGMAVWVKLDQYMPIATLDLRIDYMRAAEPGLDLLARARCYKLTRSIAFVRAWAYDRTRKDPVAAAQSAFMLQSDGGRKPGANRNAGGAL
ncbi:MAG: PaaI family thioesterase [Caulobacteraceae bacterium]|nr:PaaI family thioesterase [Caulobacteraceae bacterium]